MMFSRAGKVALCIVALSVTVLVGACAEKPNYDKIRLQTEGETSRASSVATSKTPLRVGIAAVISPKETLRSYNEILDYLGEKIDNPVELYQRQTYAEMNDLVRSGNVDLAFICTQAYVEGQSEFGLELLVAPQVRGKAEYYSYLIVPKDSPIETFEQLRGGTFAFSDPQSNSGRLAPLSYLRQIGEMPESFFKKSFFTYSHDKSIKAVAEKLVDAASVDSLVYDYHVTVDPRYTSRTKVIKKFGPYGSPPVVVRPGLDPALKEKLKGILLNMHDDEKGGKILGALLIDRFVVPDEKAYDPVRDMLANVRQ